jgi:hypothetical protein
MGTAQRRAGEILDALVWRAAWATTVAALLLAFPCPRLATWVAALAIALSLLDAWLSRASHL